MLAIERRNEILARLLADGKVIVSDLAKDYNVTEETIRRDLEKLENEGLAKKTYGGAVRNENFNVDVPYNVRKQANVMGKRHIASVIASLVTDGDYLMLDASTTALSVVQQISNKKKITLITNSIEILPELVNKSGWNVLSTGGKLKQGGLSLVGYQAERMVKSFHVDIAICSCKGLDMEMGITDSNEQDAEIKKAFFAAAKKCVLAVDSTKFDKTSFVRISDIAEVDVVVTDEEPTENWKQYLATNEVELLF